MVEVAMVVEAVLRVRLGGMNTWIDAHAHLPLDVEVGLPVERVVNICVDHRDLGGLEAQRDWYRGLVRGDGRRWGWVTSFSLDGFGSTGWADREVARLDADLAAGACGVKVWKNVGMELKDDAGNWVFVDDARFSPVFEFLAGRRAKLLMHQAEPIAAWLPLDPGNPHFGYYSTASKWHWHGRTDVPSHAHLIAARDHIIERYPEMTVIGLHLGSQEHDLPAVEERLARWENYHVDTAARLGDLAVACHNDRDGLIRFFERWKDRVLWGVDWVLTQPLGTLPVEKQGGVVQGLLRHYEVERKFFATDETQRIAGREVRGLALPESVLAPLTRGNALRLYFPGG
jgi:hypothetical protein